MHRTGVVVDEDRPRDADLVPQPTRGGELVLEARVCPELLSRMRLAGVDEVPAEAWALRRQLVEQRTLCCAIRSGERAELEDDATVTPKIRQADPLAVEDL
jgi:hypothetical protein